MPVLGDLPALVEPAPPLAAHLSAPLALPPCRGCRVPGRAGLGDLLQPVSCPPVPLHHPTVPRRYR